MERMQQQVIEALIRNPRTTAIAAFAILGALRDPAHITADNIESILLAIGLIFAKDAGASTTDK